MTGQQNHPPRRHCGTKANAHALGHCLVHLRCDRHHSSQVLRVVLRPRLDPQHLSRLHTNVRKLTVKHTEHKHTPSIYVDCSRYGLGSKLNLDTFSVGLDPNNTEFNMRSSQINKIV